MANENLGCIGFLFKFIGLKADVATSSSRSNEELPYRLSDNFLSPAELSFFHVLKNAINNQFEIAIKPRVSDLIFVAGGNKNQGHRNRIDRKHVDFVLCDPKTMEPQLVIELDDSTHQRKDRMERDKLIDSVFRAAQFPILHVTAKRAYVPSDLVNEIQAVGVVIGTSPIRGTASLLPALPTSSSTVPTVTDSNKAAPLCPKCNIPLVERVSKKGKNIGKRFWACPSFPNCRQIIPID